ncbi:MAG: hypothetical protein LIO94_03510 [Clostridiales bacterium]|nr:hypothetical protein [Clostridiales bacterium]
MLNNAQRIDAIVWKAKDKKISYGAFSSILTEGQKAEIYQEYESYWNAKLDAERKRLERITC